MKNIIYFIVIMYFFKMLPSVLSEFYDVEVLSPFYITECAAQEKGDQDIQWFKDKMGISESDKYAEEAESIYGMSWSHFIAMVLMGVFILATVVVIYLRNKRTRHMITELLKEED